LLDVVSFLLKKDGIAYLQCVAKPPTWIGGDAYRVAQREIFPGHFLETREQTESRLRNSRFRILQQWDHTYDYSLTTSRWVDGIEKNQEALARLLGSRKYRLYLGYLAFASKLFATKRGCLMRYFFQKS
jgi:cyclopropane fatty-acyl-phospholipid synthase-like methyltransferase